jgi:class 3 adenylate cyclase
VIPIAGPEPGKSIIESNVYGDGVMGRKKVHVSHEVLERVNKDLLDDTTELRRLSSWPIRRTFLYMDISDFSQSAPALQLLVLNKLLRLSKSRLGNLEEGDVEAQLCIGDGYIFVFTNAAKAVLFAAKLAHSIETANAQGNRSLRLHFRMGLHFGEVFCFLDPGRGRDEWNYVGSGINGGKRVLDAIGKDQDDVVFVSADLRDEIIANAERAVSNAILTNLQNRGRRQDKHGNWWRVYVPVSITSQTNPQDHADGLMETAALRTSPGRFAVT